MWRKRLGLALTGLAAASFAGASASAQMRIVSSDATSQFVPLEVNKSIVIELAADARDVLVANPTIANVAMRTSRRAYILGIGLGQTNIAFYDDARRQIEALDVTVQKDPVAAPFPRGPEKVVIVFRGRQGWKPLSCTHSSNLSEGAACYVREDASPTLDSLPQGSSVTMPVGAAK